MTDSFHTETVDPADPIDPPSIHIFAPGTCLGERYEIREALGIGGSAVVYAAADRHLDTAVALKVLRADRLNEGALRRFRREVAVARKANSPRLVRVFDIAETADAIYLSMELVDGDTLRDELRNGPVTIQRAVDIAIEILEALAVLHDLSIVHRDVKPGNVLFTGSGTLKLADFGLAREWESLGGARLTKTDVVVGTIEYLAPEQALGRAVDARTDLYSVGIVLFEILTGKVPHAKDSSLGTLLAHVHEDAPDVRAARPDAPRWLTSIIRRLLEKDPARRYPSAAAVLRDLRRRSGPGLAYRLRARSAISAAVVVVTAFCFVVVNAVRDHRDSRFHHLASDDRGVFAVDRRGRMLWYKVLTVPAHQAGVARLSPERKRVLIAFDGDGSGVDANREHTAGIFDVQTGRRLRSIHFPRLGRGAFPQFSETYGPARVFVDDLDGDSWDEVVVTFTHTPSYPSYTVLHDSVSNAMRPVLIASGHQRPHGAVDVDGDGIKELVFAGVLNRVGWYTGLGIVRAPVRSVASANWQAVSTPDVTYSATSERNLVWYALLPTGGYLAAEVGIDENERVLLVPYPNGKSLRVSFDAPKDRLRRKAHEDLRLAQQLSASFPVEAARSAERAVASAREAGDRILLEWCERVLASMYVGAGDDRGRVLFESLFERSSERGNIAYDAAVAFHTAGELGEAVRWYRFGYARTDAMAGRHKYEHLVGLVMALAEDSRWKEARQRIEEFVHAVPDQNTPASFCRAFVEWRETGQVPEIPEGAVTDIERYWTVELRIARGDDPGEVRTAIEHALRLDSGLRPLFISALSLCEAKLGNHAEAKRLARQAWDMTERQLAREPILRGHAVVIRGRTR